MTMPTLMIQGLVGVGLGLSHIIVVAQVQFKVSSCSRVVVAHSEKLFSMGCLVSSTTQAW